MFVLQKLSIFGVSAILFAVSTFFPLKIILNNNSSMNYSEQCYANNIAEDQRNTNMFASSTSLPFESQGNISNKTSDYNHTTPALFTSTDIFISRNESNLENSSNENIEPEKDFIYVNEGSISLNKSEGTNRTKTVLDKDKNLDILPSVDPSDTFLNASKTQNAPKINIGEREYENQFFVSLSTENKAITHINCFGETETQIGKQSETISNTTTSSISADANDDINFNSAQNIFQDESTTITLKGDTEDVNKQVTTENSPNLTFTVQEKQIDNNISDFTENFEVVGQEFHDIIHLLSNEYVEKVKAINNLTKPQTDTSNMFGSIFTPNQIQLQEKLLFLYTKYPILIYYTNLKDYIKYFEPDLYANNNKNLILHDVLVQYYHDATIKKNDSTLTKKFGIQVRKLCDEISNFMNNNNINFTNMEDFRSLYIELLFYKNTYIKFINLNQSDKKYNTKIRVRIIDSKKILMKDLKKIKPNYKRNELETSTLIFFPRILQTLMDVKILNEKISQDIWRMLPEVRITAENPVGNYSDIKDNNSSQKIETANLKDQNGKKAVICNEICLNVLTAG